MLTEIFVYKVNKNHRWR